MAELRLSLALLEAEPHVDPATLWQSLAPCLTDPTGNAHRAELNVEKLWDCAEPGRGQLGLVEMRALRMQDTPERAAALGAQAEEEAILALTRAGIRRREVWPTETSLVDGGSCRVCGWTSEVGIIHKLCVKLLRTDDSPFHVKPATPNVGLRARVSTGCARVLRRVSRETSVPVDNFCG